MSVLLITYDLCKPGQNYAALWAYIKQFSHMPLSESSYAIQTSLTPADVGAQIRQLIDESDQAYVINLTMPYWGFGPTDVHDWLNAKLTF